MYKIFIIILFVLCSSISATAQTSFKWNDSTVSFKGNKVSESIIIDNAKEPSMQSDFYYVFDKSTKTHIVHLVKTSIKDGVKSIYLIYKYLIPASSIVASDLIVETAENSSYKTGGFLYVSLRCKDDKEDIVTYEKSSHYYDFDNENKINEFSFEAGLTDKAILEKLIQQIKNNH
ncbi:MAG: hypothetical protein KA319_00870 [Ferruginibacter sp.]|nr:hypothetical protein [Ferruginibacter sp.]